MAILTASRFELKIKAFYERLIDKGKSFKVTINACQTDENPERTSTRLSLFKRPACNALDCPCLILLTDELATQLLCLLPEMKTGIRISKVVCDNMK